MTKKLLLLATVLFSLLSFSQNEILLVTDNNFDTTDNTSFYNSILTTTYTEVTLHDTNSSGLPTATQLSNYDLVIWFSGDDGYQLNFWSNGNAGNTVLTNYLDNGGKLWMIGSDIIYEMYGSAPATFSSGEFMYDYAWLASYDMQTFVDDGGLGVAQIDRNSNVNTDYPSPLTWIFPTIYYIDGVTPRENGISVYEFGPATYPNAGEITMSFYENSTFSVMSTLFNPTSIDTSTTVGRLTPNNDLDFFIQATLDHIFASSLSINDNNLTNNTLQTHPNPSQDYFNISFDNDVLLYKDFELYSIIGKVVLKGKLTHFTTRVSTKNLAKGSYFLKIGSITKKIIKY
ncbi:T9SS type A sorting domain-containing protein [Lacinutrix sp. C3R15]|uniref:T9SS type A sorting domain-containing protein n=1 Tax=Flavobacteriaceae TaxID=49546 RepID=UPI001C0A198B|nr:MULTISPECIES: T9SS type A sorting domain-containing protein [Flavobacteriaceae]MBU2938768.1 T9SS type A sorting domain-containing protein [Lacinutrix sp. C3R15]MDO6622081.1 T9SS type A sorting domain-containing protein [Oceanihabitans sp. 1_MG-2023]